MELTIYAVARASESLALVLDRIGAIPRWVLRTRADVVAFALAAGAILQCYSGHCGRHRDVFRAKYLNVLDFVLGNAGVEDGSIRHVPSTRELAAIAVRRIASAPGLRGALGPSQSGKVASMPLLADGAQAGGSGDAPGRSSAPDDPGSVAAAAAPILGELVGDGPR